MADPYRTLPSRRAPPPTGDCPKCGQEDAWSDSRPRYTNDFGANGLRWGCRYCGFEKLTAALDTERAPRTRVYQRSAAQK